MGLRFHKSIKICKGVRVNFSKGGVGISLGTRGLRYSVSTKRRSRMTVGIPGTGISYLTSFGSKKSPTKRVQSHVSSRSTIITSSDGTKHECQINDVLKYRKVMEILEESYKSCEPTIDWQSIIETKEPYDINDIGPIEEQAIHEYETLTPSFTDKMIRGAFEKKKAKAKELINAAKAEDKANYDAWNHDNLLAKRILSGDIDAYYEVIENINPLQEISGIGADFEIGTDDPRYIEVEFQTNANEVLIPDKLEITPSGNISMKHLSKSEMYHNQEKYICSYCVKLAREFFAALPIDTVFVHAVDQNQTILSVKFERSVFERTDFNSLSINTFVYSFLHNVKYLKTQGFRAVERLNTETMDMRVDNTTHQIPVSTKSTGHKLNVEIPPGWIVQNNSFLQPFDEKMTELATNVKTAKSVDQEIYAIKNLIRFYYYYQDECKRKGLLFEKYFEEMHTYSNGKKDIWINSYKSRLEELEENFLDFKAKEQAVANVSPNLKNEITETIRCNPGIFQKDLVKKYDPLIKEIILQKLWEIQCDGILIKEKQGKFNKLYIKD